VSRFTLEFFLSNVSPRVLLGHGAPTIGVSLRAIRWLQPMGMHKRNLKCLKHERCLPGRYECREPASIEHILQEAPEAFSRPSLV
jgi:hypothetical protein